jgi:quercetin dioxygenase-like cupin family protein
MATQPVFARSSDGPTYRVVGDTIRVLAGSQDTGGVYEVFEMRGPRESGPPPHSHPWSEAYFVVEGEVEVTVGAGSMVAAAGCFVNVPPGTLHTYRILSDGARFVIVTSPAGAADFFRDLDRETGGSCEDLPAIMRVALRHGFTVPAPPVG